MSANETHAEVIAEMRLGNTGPYQFAYLIGRPSANPLVPGIIERVTVSELADRLDAAYRREAKSIERIVRDAIIDYTEQYVNAPNDDVEREIQHRAEVANNWLKQHGFAEEPTNWSKEEIPCL